MTSRAAVYQGRKAQKKYSIADRRRARAEKLAAAGKKRQAKRVTKRADRAEKAGSKAADRYSNRRRVGTEGNLGGTLKSKTSPRRRVVCGTRSGAKPAPSRGGRCGTRSGAKPAPSRGGRCGTRSRKPRTPGAIRKRAKK